MEAAFPQQAAMLSEMTNTMVIVEGCIAGAVSKLDRIQISLNELEAMKRGLSFSHIMPAHTNLLQTWLIINLINFVAKLWNGSQLLIHR
jgi:hypothetical protein